MADDRSHGEREQDFLFSSERERHDLLKDGKLAKLLKVANENAPSLQGRDLGRKAHPFNFQAAIDFKDDNIYHSACIEAKTASAIGLGFMTPGEIAKATAVPAPAPAPSPEGAPAAPAPAPEPPIDPRERSRIEEVLDPLCEVSLHELLTDVVQDLWQVGNGYMEVVRETPGDARSPIAALYHIPAAEIYKFLRDRRGNYHFVIISSETMEDTTLGELHLARFGDLANVAGQSQRYAGDETSAEAWEIPSDASEVIHFRKPSSRSRWYGWPDWLSGVPTMELDGASTQHLFDFFYNRGVPEFFLFLLGPQLATATWEKLQAAVKANIGVGNSHKSIALHIPNKDMKVQLEKLAVDGKSDGLYGELADVLATRIVSAHGVPPLLAGIQIPGKLGATNELPNALQAFQLLKIGPAQKLIKATLVNTLVSPGQRFASRGGAPETLDAGDLLFRTILDEINIGNMDTVARMRQTLPEARAQGRDPSKGLKD